MNRRPTLRLALILLSACSGMGARATAAALPSDYFPPEAKAPADIEGWRRLAAEKPLLVRIRDSGTPADDGTERSSAAPVVLGPRTVYLRVRDLARDLPAVGSALDSPRLVLDMRFTISAAPEALQFGQLLARRPVELPPASANADAIVVKPSGKRAQDQITVILVNSDTHGPVEALLAALQMSGDVLLAGTTTAGDTGSFEPCAEIPAVEVIRGEYRPAPGVSILGEGVRPRLDVEVGEADDRAAYQAFLNDTPLIELLNPSVDKARLDEATLLERHGRNGDVRGHSVATARDEKVAAEDAPTPDLILQRGVNALIAYEALRGP